MKDKDTEGDQKNPHLIRLASEIWLKVIVMDSFFLVEGAVLD